MAALPPKLIRRAPSYLECSRFEHMIGLKHGFLPLPAVCKGAPPRTAQPGGALLRREERLDLLSTAHHK
eukprot:scaffold780_cov99-Isochrysis_galbana.AAC.4